MISNALIAMRPNRLSRTGWLVAVTVMACAFWQDAMAATHVVPTSTSVIDCGTYAGGIRAGDVVVLKGPTRGKVTIRNCKGTADRPIKIQNDTAAAGPLIIEQSGDGFQSLCTDCEHVVWDGSGKWAGAPAGACGISVADGDRVLGRSQCGIVFRCVSGSPHSGLRFNGSSKNFTVKGIEIDGNFPTCASGVGLSVNDHQYELADHPGEWREGIRLLNNYIHDSGKEAVYFGGNVNPDKGGAGDLPLRNNEIAYNYIDRPGCDGIKYKNSIAGLSSIHHNHVTNTGQSSDGPDSGCTSAGIILFEAGYTDVYSNYVESPAPKSSGAGACITQNIVYQPAAVVAKLPVRIFNNVVHNCKGTGINSIVSGLSSAEPSPSIYNNTVVAPVGGTGINVGSAVNVCDVRSNIVAGAKTSVSQCATARNNLEPVDAQKFRDAKGKDFRLTVSSPAVEAGGSTCPAEDIWGGRRPSGAACDVGAFEYTSDGDSVKPAPPIGMAVE
jgi:hypothetical protein